jgi:proline iminopeptidase
MTRWVSTSVLALLLALSVPDAADGQPRARQGLVSLEDARLFYEVVGEGTPILVVHGGPGLDHAYLQPGLDVLASHGALVYYDQRATGRSQAELDSTAINVDAFLGDMERLRETLGHEEWVVLGHSFGGLLALAYARAHPERTRGLVLLSTVEPGRRWAERAAARLAAARTPEDSAAMARIRESEAFQARDPQTLSRYQRLAYRATLRDPERVDELSLELAGPTARNGGEVARLLGASLGEIDWWDDLATLDVPTLVVHGRHDPAPPAMARALADTLPRGRYEELEAGHFPWVEDAPRLVEAVTTFLQTLER